MNTIVVGIDDSEESKNALRFGVEEGRLRGVPVVALHAWQVPPLPPAIDVAPTVPPIDPAIIVKLEEAAARLVERVVDEVVANDSTVDVRATVVEGQPASALMDAVGDDDLLIVGSHGLGGIKVLLLGSVSREVVNHAPCPVVVHRRGRR
jgi:nucleotide-binding universal stress UspA family protein